MATNRVFITFDKIGELTKDDPAPTGKYAWLTSVESNPANYRSGLMVNEDVFRAHVEDADNYIYVEKMVKTAEEILREREVIYEREYGPRADATTNSQ